MMPLAPICDPTQLLYRSSFPPNGCAVIRHAGARPRLLHLALQIRRRLSFMQVDNFWIGSGQKETYSTLGEKKKTHARPSAAPHRGAARPCGCVFFDFPSVFEVFCRLSHNYQQTLPGFVY